MHFPSGRPGGRPLRNLSFTVVHTMRLDCEEGAAKRSDVPQGSFLRAKSRLRRLRYARRLRAVSLALQAIHLLAISGKFLVVQCWLVPQIGSLRLPRADASLSAALAMTALFGSSCNETWALPHIVSKFRGYSLLGSTACTAPSMLIQ